MVVLLVTGLVAASGVAVGAAASEQSIQVDHATVLQPGEQTTITVSGTEAGDISVKGELAGWIVNSTDPSTLTTFPNSADTPYTTQPGESWGQIFATTGNNTFEVTVTAPEATGSYNFTAVVSDNETSASENFTIKVTETSVSVDHEESVTAGSQTTVTVNGTNAGDLRVSGDVADWVVNETSPATLTTAPSPSQTPYVTPSGDVWGQVYSDVGNQSFELTLTAPNATGTYNFTAEAVGTNTSVTEGFSVEVTEPTQSGPPQGVSEDTYDAATGNDGELSRQDILRAVNNFIRGDPIGQGISVSREELLVLVKAFIASA